MGVPGSRGSSGVVVRGGSSCGMGARVQSAEPASCVLEGFVPVQGASGSCCGCVGGLPGAVEGGELPMNSGCRCQHRGRQEGSEGGSGRSATPPSVPALPGRRLVPSTGGRGGSRVRRGSCRGSCLWLRGRARPWRPLPEVCLSASSTRVAVETAGSGAGCVVLEGGRLDLAVAARLAEGPAPARVVVASWWRWSASRSVTRRWSRDAHASSSRGEAACAVCRRCAAAGDVDARSSRRRGPFRPALSRLARRRGRPSDVVRSRRSSWPRTAARSSGPPRQPFEAEPVDGGRGRSTAGRASGRRRGGSGATWLVARIWRRVASGGRTPVPERPGMAGSPSQQGVRGRVPARWSPATPASAASP